MKKFKLIFVVMKLIALLILVVVVSGNRGMYYDFDEAGTEYLVEEGKQERRSLIDLKVSRDIGIVKHENKNGEFLVMAPREEFIMYEEPMSMY